jgi:hypothetical protein
MVIIGIVAITTSPLNSIIIPPPLHIIPPYHHGFQLRQALVADLSCIHWRNALSSS